MDHVDLDSILDGRARKGRGHRIVKRFRGGLVFQDHRLLYISTVGLRVIEKKKRRDAVTWIRRSAMPRSFVKSF